MPLPPYPPLLGNIKVYPEPLLPIEDGNPACDLESRQEYLVPNGSWIHAYKLGDNVLLVSPKVYDHWIKSKPLGELPGITEVIQQAINSKPLV